MSTDCLPAYALTVCTPYSDNPLFKPHILTIDIRF